MNVACQKERGVFAERLLWGGRSTVAKAGKTSFGSSSSSSSSSSSNSSSSNYLTQWIGGRGKRWNVRHVRLVETFEFVSRRDNESRRTNGSHGLSERPLYDEKVRRKNLESYSRGSASPAADATTSFVPLRELQFWTSAHATDQESSRGTLVRRFPIDAHTRVRMYFSKKRSTPKIEIYFGRTKERVYLGKCVHNATDARDRTKFASSACCRCFRPYTSHARRCVRCERWHCVECKHMFMRKISTKTYQCLDDSCKRKSTGTRIWGRKMGNHLRLPREHAASSSSSSSTTSRAVTSDAPGSAAVVGSNSVNGWFEALCEAVDEAVLVALPLRLQNDDDDDELPKLPYDVWQRFFERTLKEKIKKSPSTTTTTSTSSSSSSHVGRLSEPFRRVEPALHGRLQLHDDERGDGGGISVFFSGVLDEVAMFERLGGVAAEGRHRRRQQPRVLSLRNIQIALRPIGARLSYVSSRKSCESGVAGGGDEEEVDDALTFVRLCSSPKKKGSNSSSTDAGTAQDDDDDDGRMSIGRLRLVLAENMIRPRPFTAGGVVDFDSILGSRNHSSVPSLPRTLWKQIVEVDGLKEVHIFRQAPMHERRNRVRLCVCRGTFGGTDDPHMLASLLKLWARSLRPRVLSGWTLEGSEEAVMTPSFCRKRVAALSPDRRAVFLWFLDVMCRVAARARENRMGPHDVATIFAAVFVDDLDMRALSFKSPKVQMEAAVRERARQVSLKNFLVACMRERLSLSSDDAVGVVKISRVRAATMAATTRNDCDGPREGRSTSLGGTVPGSADRTRTRDGAAVLAPRIVSAAKRCSLRRLLAETGDGGR